MAYTREEKREYAKKKAAERKAKGGVSQYQQREFKPRPTYRKKGAPKKKTGILESFNNGILDVGNGIVKGMLGQLPGISTIMGNGDYRVKSNSLMKGGVPQFASKGRSVVVRHREYIGDVISGAAGTFDIKSYPINPGLPQTFPWLANVASQYEEYKITGMVFSFQSMSANALNSTNTALGQVIMATQYNVLSLPFASKQQMENYQFACSTKPADSCIHPIECEPRETPLTELYIRGYNVPTAGSDARLYDFGNFYIATNGLQASNVNLGELWVTYEIKLFKPKMGSTIQVADHFRAVGLVDTTNPLGTAPVVQSSSNLGSTFSGQTLTLPSWYTGRIFVEYNATGSSAALTVPTIVVGGGVSKINLFNNGATSQTGVGATSTTMNFSATFSVQQGGTIQFQSGTYPTAVGFADLFVIAMPLTN